MTSPDNDQSGEMYEQFDDEGVLPDLEKPLGVFAHGTTADEAEEGAKLDDRVKAEEPEALSPEEASDQAAESGAVYEIPS